MQKIITVNGEVNQVINTTEEMLSSIAARRYRILRSAAEMLVTRRLIPYKDLCSYRDTDIVNPVILDRIFMPESSQISAAKARCTSTVVVGSGIKRMKHVQFDEFDQSICKDCAFYAQNCPIALSQGGGIETPLPTGTRKAAAEGERRYQSPDKVYPQRSHEKLGMPKIDQSQLDILPKIRGDKTEPEQVDRVIWERIVKYFSYYPNLSTVQERTQSIKSEEGLNWIRLILNGVDGSLLLNGRKNEKLRRRLEDSLRYAYSGNSIPSFWNLGNCAKTEESQVVKVLQGLDNLEGVLDKGLTPEEKEEMPHLVDFYTYLANGNDIEDIASAFGLFYQDGMLTQHRFYLNRFLLGELTENEQLYSHFLIPSSISMIYFLGGSRYRQGSHDAGLIDTTLLNLGRNLFNARSTEICEAVRLEAGEESATRVSGMILLLRRYYRSMLSSALLIDKGEEDMKVISCALDKLDGLPEEGIRLLTMPQQKFPESRLGIRKIYGTAPNLSLEALSEKDYWCPDYLSHAVNAFLNTVLNLQIMPWGSMETMSVQDWIDVSSSHRLKCARFAMKVYSRLHPESRPIML